MTERDHISDRFYAEDKMTDEPKTPISPEEIEFEKSVEEARLRFKAKPLEEQVKILEEENKYLREDLYSNEKSDRFELAKVAMHAYLNRPIQSKTQEAIAEVAWQMADAMLKARDEK